MADSPRTASKDVTMSFFGGTVNLTVDVVNARVAEDSGFKLICPDEPEPLKPVQMYVHPDDVDGSGPVRMWSNRECDRAREVDKILYRVTQDEIEAAKEPVLPPGEFTVHVFAAPHVEATTRPGGAVYRLRPKNAPPVYAAMVQVVDDPTLAFVGELTMKGVQRMYRLTSWNGTLLLQELVRPGEFHEAEDYSYEFPDALPAKLLAAAEAVVEGFDPEQFKNDLRQRAAILDAAKRDPNNVVVPAKPAVKAKDNVDDLMAALDAMVAPKKPARKKA